MVRASKAYATGEQAFFSYSCASNGRLLLSGGFIVPGNPWDSVELALTLPLLEAALPLYAELSRTLDGGHERGGAFAEFMPSEFLQQVIDVTDGCDWLLMGLIGGFGFDW